ncbi:MAG: hypothetical protein ACM359_01100 [Bacillota bacterium]
MSKRQLIEAIRDLNPTAQLPFLSQFEEGELHAYLKRLQETIGERIRIGMPAVAQASVRMVS